MGLQSQNKKNMTDIYKNNLSAQAIIRSALARSNRPLNKYNESMHQSTEEISSEPNDRTSADIGMEMELTNNQ